MGYKYGWESHIVWKDRVNLVVFVMSNKCYIWVRMNEMKGKSKEEVIGNRKGNSKCGLWRDWPSIEWWEESICDHMGCTTDTFEITKEHLCPW